MILASSLVSIDARIISDLSVCSYISAKENVILIGDSGTGKAHLDIGLALKALTRYILFISKTCLSYPFHDFLDSDNKVSFA